MANTQPRWLRIREAAADLRVSETTIRSWLSTGKLEGFKIHGVVRVDREAINKLAKTQPYLASASKGRPSPRSWWPHGWTS